MKEIRNLYRTAWLLLWLPMVAGLAIITETIWLSTTMTTVIQPKTVIYTFCGTPPADGTSISPSPSVATDSKQVLLSPEQKLSSGNALLTISETSRTRSVVNSSSMVGASQDIKVVPTLSVQANLQYTSSSDSASRSSSTTRSIAIPSTSHTSFPPPTPSSELKLIFPIPSTFSNGTQSSFSRPTTIVSLFTKTMMTRTPPATIMQTLTAGNVFIYSNGQYNSLPQNISAHLPTNTTSSDITATSLLTETLTVVQTLERRNEVAENLALSADLWR